MRKKKGKLIFPVILVVLLIALAIGVSYFFDTGEGVPYSVSTTGEGGASLLFDTLRHMGYSPRTTYHPLNRDVSTDSVYIIIQPRTPTINQNMADEMLEWVHNGGRLIFLSNQHPNSVLNRAAGTPGRDGGDFLLYRIGYGEMITGRAAQITNIYLMDSHTAGEAIQTTISRWNSEREIDNIFFGEYYHGFHTTESFVARMPLIFRLAAVQILILAVVAVWHLGKRFGNPTPLYEEIEREENEYIRALARLYMSIKK